LYRGQPVGHRTGGGVMEGWRYLTTCWPNSGHAHATADRLNRRFSCEDFTVALATEWQAVTRP